MVQHEVQRCCLRNCSEIPHEIVGQLRIDGRRNRLRTRHHTKGITVRRSLRGNIHGDCARRTWPIIHDNLATPRFGKLLRNGTCGGIRATSGRHALKVRATDRKGALQLSQRAKPFPNGSSGIQEVVVFVK